MDYLLLIARVFFVYIFFHSAPGNFKPEKAKAAAANGLPLASLLVPFATVLSLVGATSILFGIEARWGAWLIIIFLIPVTLIQHKFWTIDDPLKRRMQYINFMKNISIIGGALFIAVYGTGPLSIDALF